MNDPPEERPVPCKLELTSVVLAVIIEEFNVKLSTFITPSDGVGLAPALKPTILK